MDLLWNEDGKKGLEFLTRNSAYLTVELECQQDSKNHYSLAVKKPDSEPVCKIYLTSIQQASLDDAINERTEWKERKHISEALSYKDYAKNAHKVAQAFSTRELPDTPLLPSAELNLIKIILEVCSTIGYEKIANIGTLLPEDLQAADEHFKTTPKHL